MKRALFIVLWTLGTLAACGLKGPLYLPGQSPKSAPWPPPAQTQPPTPAPPHVPDLPAASEEKK